MLDSTLEIIHIIAGIFSSFVIGFVCGYAIGIRRSISVDDIV